MEQVVLLMVYLTMTKTWLLNLGFTGFRRGYDFYKSDWKYLNDPTMRGGLTTGAINRTISSSWFYYCIRPDFRKER